MIPEVAKGLQEIAAEEARTERCGFLLGETCGSSVLVRGIMPVQNCLTTSDHFAIPSSELNRALTREPSRSGVVVGLYHTHDEGSSKMSRTDERSARRHPFVWLIVSRAGPRATNGVVWGAYLWGHNELAEIPIIFARESGLHESRR